MRLAQDALEVGQHVRLEPNILHVHQQGLPVEQAQHQLLPVDHRQGGHPHIHDAPVHGELEAPVLGQPPLRDVHGGQDLDAGDHPGIEGLGRRGHLLQHAVHAQAHRDLLFVRLEMDVAGPVAHRLQQQQVHEPHHRRIVGQQAQLVVLHRRVIHRGHHLVRLRAHQLAQVALDVGLLGIGAVDHRLDAGLRADRLVDVQRSQGADGVQGMQVQRVLHDQGEAGFVVALQGHHAEAAGHRLRDELDLLLLQPEFLAQLLERDLELDGQGPGDVLIRHIAQVAQGLPERVVRPARRMDGLGQLLRRDAAGLNQNIA